MLTVYLFLSLPFCQEWLAGKVATLLAEQLKTKVEVGRVQVGLTGHAIVDDLHVWDRQQRPMLNVTRTGVKINLFQLIRNGSVIINSAQLYGATAHLSKERPDTAFNFQFVIDAFKKKENEPKKPLPHIEIRSIQVRHTDVTLDLNWKNKKSKDIFDPFHLSVSNLALSATLNLLMDDTCNVDVQRLSFKEASGLQVTKSYFSLEQGKKSGVKVSGLRLELPDTYLDAPLLHFNTRKVLAGTLSAHIVPNDISVFYPPLQKVNDAINLTLIAAAGRDNATISRLEINDEMRSISLSANAKVKRTKDKIPDLDVNINKLVLSSNIEQIIKPFKPISSKLHSLLVKTEKLDITGSFQHESKTFSGKCDLASAIGKVKANGSYHEGQLKAHADVEHLNVGAVWNAIRDSSNIFGKLTAVVDVDGKLKGSNGKPEGHAKAIVKEAEIKGHKYENVRAEIAHKGTYLDATFTSSDPLAHVAAEFHMSTSKLHPYAKGIVNIHNIDFAELHLTKNKRFHRLRSTIGIDLEGNKLDNMAGNISIPHIIINTADTVVTLTGIQLISSPESGDTRHVSITSPYFMLQLDGTFHLISVAKNFQMLAHRCLPDLVKAPKGNLKDADLQLTAEITDPSPLHPLLGADLALDDGPLKVSVGINSNNETLQAEAKTPKIRYGKQELQDVSLSLSTKGQDLSTSLHLQRIMKGHPVNVDLNVASINNLLNTSLKWKVDNDQLIDGEIAMRGTIEKNTEGGLAVVANVQPTTLHINDTLWTISRSQMYFRNKELYVDGFQLATNDGQRSLTIHGVASRNDDDTLRVELDDISMDYIFELAQVKPVRMGGNTTGEIVARHVFRNPVAEANVHVTDFTFNSAPMGELQAYLGWGLTPGNLDLRGTVTDAAAGERMDVDGYLHLLKDPIQTLDINIGFTRANLAFMNRYVAGIMSDFAGRASGNVRIYGDFGNVDMEGDIFAHECALTVPSLNVRYHTVNESIHLEPGLVALNGIRAYDRDGSPNKTEHSATVTGKITFEHFRNMHYWFDISGNDILAYDTHDFGEMPFYCTAIGTGDVHLNGGPGYVNIDMNVTPSAGTVLTYNASSPKTLTQAGFVTYVDRSRMIIEEEERKKQKAKEEEEKKRMTDMHINFNINLTPEAKLRMLMDPRSGDYITVYGSTHMLATYYNKGNFQMYGTYRVDHGNYNLTLQEVIHKDFQIKTGSTMVFGGNPFEGDLNIQAIYTVPSVSLNDLSAKGTFSNSTVRVNCLMNITGKAKAPRVGFDFEIPNVNEDEARMVHALISTEEERNMQVIYLLGIGRFYTYDYSSATQTQSATAVNSLLSSTLSGQINQMLTNMIGKESNWNFGANLSTGTMGWSDMDVEGMLSGRLLNNRLLINGRFGYRDNPVAQSNFVGDFDIQYLLTKSGSIVLKAYSETNDRYFTKSALTTQGIGIQLKKDFSSWRDLFILHRNKKKNIKESEEQKTDSIH